MHIKKSKEGLEALAAFYLVPILTHQFTGGDNKGQFWTGMKRIPVRHHPTVVRGKLYHWPYTMLRELQDEYKLLCDEGLFDEETVPSHGERTAEEDAPPATQ